MGNVFFSFPLFVGDTDADEQGNVSPGTKTTLNTLRLTFPCEMLNEVGYAGNEVGSVLSEVGCMLSEVGYVPNEVG